MDQFDSGPLVSRLKILLMVVLIVMGLVLFLAHMMGVFKSDKSAEPLRVMIRQEIAADSNREVVEKWLEKQKFYYRFSDKTSDWMINGKTPATLAGLEDKNLGGLLWGQVRGPVPKFGFNCAGEINVYFFFDRHGKLVGHLVRPFEFSL